MKKILTLLIISGIFLASNASAADVPLYKIKLDKMAYYPGDTVYIEMVVQNNTNDDYQISTRADNGDPTISWDNETGKMDKVTIRFFQCDNVSCGDFYQSGVGNVIKSSGEIKSGTERSIISGSLILNDDLEPGQYTIDFQTMNGIPLVNVSTLETFSRNISSIITITEDPNKIIKRPISRPRIIKKK